MNGLWVRSKAECSVEVMKAGQEQGRSIVHHIRTLLRHFLMKACSTSVIPVDSLSVKVMAVLKVSQSNF